MFYLILGRLKSFNDDIIHLLSDVFHHFSLTISSLY
jgi:hypothetical protein